MTAWERTPAAAWLASRPLKLARVDPASTPRAPGDRDATDKASARLRAELSELQEALRAEETRSVLLVLQAMDAGGKDGCVKSVFAGVNPMGLQHSSFAVPTPEELSHDFLWRIHAECPGKGIIGIFNRSHYEDVLAVRVRNLVARPVWQARYGQIQQFEEMLTASGTQVLKVMLHISKEEQRLRLQKRIDNPAKRWKFRMGDLDDRKLWLEYQRAYEDAIDKTSTPHAPWFVVPADKKWYRDFAVLTILVAALRSMKPKHPPFPEFDGVVVD